ncbi:uncharacterized protein LOC134709641 isoform X2 [Mytilus trossulus]|uniref:uncharacterized protein LOC134709641 isoform X2 n=1 Tax=Mytilus trossulus TaxID=6551 RepID=UPI00300681E3
MDGCGKSLILLILSLVTLCCSLILFIIGLFTVSWMKTSGVGTSYDYGLFKERDCDRDRCTYTTWSEIMNEDWYRATQAMECLGLISLVLALLVLLLYFCVPSCKVRKALYGMIFFTFLAVMFIVIGIAIFGSTFDEKGFDVGWSMGLAIAAALLAFISGILQILEMT